MAFRDVNDTIEDLARTGLAVGRKIIGQMAADERTISPELVSQLVDGLHPNRMRAKVNDMIEETSSTRTLRLVPVEGGFAPFRAGQFVNLFLRVDGVNTSRPYSISSSPARTGYIDITVREMPKGFVSKYLCNEVKVGDKFELSGPAGGFYHDTLVDSDDLVFLAGGSGITPFMSMIRQAAETGGGPKMHLIYGSRVPDDIIFADELAVLAEKMDNLEVDTVISEPPESYKGVCGLLEADLIKELVGPVRGKTFYLCGPLAMYDLCFGALEQLKVPGRRIKQELSGPPPDITRVEGWPKKIKAGKEFELSVEGKRKKYKIKAGEPLLNSLERNKMVIDSLCRSGECGYCRTRLLEGEIFMSPSVTMKKSDVVFGYIHPCMSYPMSDIKICL